jgi:acetyltransferase-like isoleucine patch superfamily enzyme
MIEIILKLWLKVRSIKITVFTFLVIEVYKQKKQLFVGKNNVFNGSPILKIAQHSKIIFGDNLLVNSDVMSNVAGIITPCIFATIRQGAEIKIGNNVGVSSVSIVSATRIIIDDEVQIGAGSCIWDTDFHPIDPNLRIQSKTDHYHTKQIHIKRNVFIGARSIILKGVTIGENSVIGAGSVVVSNVPDNTIYAGNPACLIKNISL